MSNGRTVEDTIEICVLKAFLQLRRPFGVVDDESNVSEHMISDNSNFELHEVHGECASLIGEDVLDLSQLLVEGR